MGEGGQFLTVHFQIKSLGLICTVVKLTKNVFVSTTIIKECKFCVASLKTQRQSNTPFQSYEDSEIFAYSSDLCCSSYEQVSTQAFWYLCRQFFLTYSLAYITEPVFLPFLNASSVQKWKKTRIYNSEYTAGNFM